jgi:hypothetical protein
MKHNHPRPWGVHRLADMLGSDSDKSCMIVPDGNGGSRQLWVRSVPAPYSGNRLVAAWWVLRGRAYAVEWPKAGELEKALEQ